MSFEKAVAKIKIRYIAWAAGMILGINMLIQAIIGNVFAALLNLFLFWFVVWYDARIRARRQD